MFDTCGKRNGTVFALFDTLNLLIGDDSFRKAKLMRGNSCLWTWCYTVTQLKTYKRYSYRSKHCAAVRPIIGAIVLHWVGISLAKCSSFSSSSLDHSVFLILGSNHSYQRALHCFADLRCNNEAIRDHWFFPYFITAALRISSWNKGYVDSKIKAISTNSKH